MRIRKLLISILFKFLPSKFIVYGHFISLPGGPDGPPYRYPTLNELTDFVTEARSAGYTFVNPIDYFVRESLQKILITFDDGFENLFSVAQQLAAMNVPCLISFLGVTLKNPNYRFLSGHRSEIGFLSSSQLQELKDSGTFIAYHSFEHRRLTGNVPKAGITELIFGNNDPTVVMNMLSAPKTFVFPYEAPTNRLEWCQALKQLGFEIFLDTRGSVAQHGALFERISMDHSRVDLAQNPIFANLFRLPFRLIKRRVGL